MPWTTPQLREVRSMIRDAVAASLPGADANVPNSVLRVMSDNQGGLCHLTLQYIDWLALQLLPDTAETEWLDRHGQIWLVNADGSKGRKLATLAAGAADFQGVIDGTVIPAGTQLQSGVAMPVDYESLNNVVSFETMQDITTSVSGPVTGNIRALDPGSFGNLAAGTSLSFSSPGVPGVSLVAIVDQLEGGTDDETDDELRARVLLRIQQPPMGGDLEDYVQWALQYPGVTRAWAASEMGIGTITVRFLMDDLRADNDGWPYQNDVNDVQAYIDSVRPVTVKDCFVLAPIKQHIDITITNLVPFNPEVEVEIEASIRAMLVQMAAPGQTIYQAWVNYAIMSAPSVQSFDLESQDFVMLSVGNMAVLGTIYFLPPGGVFVQSGAPPGSPPPPSIGSP
jgi:uncharacterized phage protein gp47/JayE